jgi:amino acid adenylation domain-containing protein
VSIFGVLKAGATYVPLDATAPMHRLRLVLRDCAIRHLIAWAPDTDLGNASRAPLVPPCPLDLLIAAGPGSIHNLREFAARTRVEWEAALSSGRDRTHDIADVAPIESDLAYILYTSGSTGAPKGVMISHAAALAFVRWASAKFEVTQSDRLANHAPLHFDLSVFDIFAAVLAGACICPVPGEVAPFPAQLAKWVRDEGISIWYSVPSALTLLALRGGLRKVSLPDLRLILFAGEVFPLKHLRSLADLLPDPRLFNLYGPTETNVCTYYEVDRRELGQRTVPLPIGRACENTDVFALNEGGGPVQRIGELGELLVRGPTLAHGYWGQPQLTSQRFVQNPRHTTFADTVYRTGDMVSLDADGNYLFMGRVDHQVKSRGYRIELGDVESALHDHPFVREAVVLALPDELAGNRLEAFVSLVDGVSAPSSALQQHCAERLPGYMIPERIHMRAELPRTATGKVDRSALLAAAANEGRA